MRLTQCARLPAEIDVQAVHQVARGAHALIVARYSYKLNRQNHIYDAGTVMYDAVAVMAAILVVSFLRITGPSMLPMANGPARRYDGQVGLGRLLVVTGITPGWSKQRDTAERSTGYLPY
jgi:hypothetical protein